MFMKLHYLHALGTRIKASGRFMLASLWNLHAFESHTSCRICDHARAMWEDLKLSRCNPRPSRDESCVMRASPDKVEYDLNIFWQVVRAHIDGILFCTYTSGFPVSLWKVHFCKTILFVSILESTSATTRKIIDSWCENLIFHVGSSIRWWKHSRFLTPRRQKCDRGGKNTGGFPRRPGMAALGRCRGWI